MPPAVDRFVLNPTYQANTYVVRAFRGSPDAVVIDPGGDPAPLQIEIAAMGARTSAILVTHSDIDHIAGVAELAEQTSAHVWIPSGEAAPLRAGLDRNDLPVRPHDAEHEIRDGDTLHVAGLNFDVVGIPGQSADHVAFAAEGQLFTGDLLFAGSVGRVDFRGGDWQTLLDSIRMLIARFGPDAVVHPGHGLSTTLGRELESNPFLHELRAAAE